MRATLAQVHGLHTHEGQLIMHILWSTFEIMWEGDGMLVSIKRSSFVFFCYKLLKDEA